MTDNVRIECYQPRYREDFIRLNRQWIETYFRLEVSDLKTFARVDDSVTAQVIHQTKQKLLLTIEQTPIGQWLNQQLEKRRMQREEQQQTQRRGHHL